ncbi:MAG: hypothetical protein KDI60_10640 [Xanthomonadales bacterium]|nr:hypothetical protein [Xanthomonadales bacterium]MCB1612197.1 hypothetical protein [Xanthomonadales bacterium]
MSRALIAALEKLLAATEELRASAFSDAQRRALDQLTQRTGALSREPRGGGSVYCVRQPGILQEHLSALRPLAADAIDPDLPQRAANIAGSRDSKARRHRHVRCYLLCKTVGSPVHWTRGERSLDLSVAVRETGAAALALSSDDGWHSEAPLWLVENQALFDRLDWFPDAGPATVAYYAGQLSGELLGWLAHTPRAPRVVLFADYDGTGLLNYARLHAATRGACTFWLMPGWTDLLRRYGNRELWQRCHADVERARLTLEQLGAEPELQSLCRTMAIEGAALEHEAVWLNLETMVDRSSKLVGR